jgi:trehalose 6-phosphate phosphatase
MVETLIQELQAGHHLAIMLDYDGTLTPIVARPEDAQLDAEGLQTLIDLAIHPQIRLALISGRSVEQLQGFIKSILPQPILLAGLHGGQVWDAQNNQCLAEPDENLVNLKAQFLQDVYDHILTKYGELPQGITFEEKGYSFALHYRLADDAVGQDVHQIFQNAFDLEATIHNAFRVQAGHSVVEIVPKPFNKGAGVRFCVDYWQKTHPETPFFPLFAGDDKTDEVGLKAVLALGGAGIAVNVDPQEMLALSHQERDALWVLQDPAEMQGVLKALVQALSPLS